MPRFPLPRLVAPVLVLATGPVGATELARHVWSGATLSAAAGSFRLAGTLGEAGPVGPAAGGSFALSTGFWGPVLGLRATGAPLALPGPPPLVNALGQNFPNPFGGSTRIAFSLRETSPVRVDVFDVAGRRIATLVDGHYAPGRWAADWNGRDAHGLVAATGVYFYRIEAGAWSDTRRMLKLR